MSEIISCRVSDEMMADINSTCQRLNIKRAGWLKAAAKAKLYGKDTTIPLPFPKVNISATVRHIMSDWEWYTLAEIARIGDIPPEKTGSIASRIRDCPWEKRQNHQGEWEYRRG